MPAIRELFDILMFISFCKQCLFVLIGKGHQNNWQGASYKQQYERPVPACHFSYVTENDVGKNGGSEEVPEELGTK